MYTSYIKHALFKAKITQADEVKKSISLECVPKAWFDFSLCSFASTISYHNVCIEETNQWPFPVTL